MASYSRRFALSTVGWNLTSTKNFFLGVATVASQGLLVWFVLSSPPQVAKTSLTFLVNLSIKFCLVPIPRSLHLQHLVLSTLHFGAIVFHLVYFTDKNYCHARVFVVYFNKVVIVPAHILCEDLAHAWRSRDGTNSNAITPAASTIKITWVSRGSSSQKGRWINSWVSWQRRWCSKLLLIRGAIGHLDSLAIQKTQQLKVSQSHSN